MGGDGRAPAPGLELPVCPQSTDHSVATRGCVGLDALGLRLPRGTRAAAMGAGRSHVSDQGSAFRTGSSHATRVLPTSGKKVAIIVTRPTAA